MSIANNNITIVASSGYSPSFFWQAGINSNAISPSDLQFRATIRPLHGNEDFTRIPSPEVLYEETGIFVDSNTNLGQWSFPLETNASISGGPYRDYQVVIEAHDNNGNTSAGNLIDTSDENGWVAFNQGYDILAVSNPRQTGIELGNNLSTRLSLNTGTNLFGLTGSGFYQNSGNGFFSYNFLDPNGGINIRFSSGTFNSNLVGGYLYIWTGQFPKLETLLRSGIYGSGIIKSRFDFNPNDGYIHHASAAVPFRGANYVYASVSFYDNLDQEAIDNGIDISTGLYLSDNAICYNDIAAGSISIGNTTIYSMQYTGNAPATGVLGTGITILGQQYYNGNTTVTYFSNPISVINYSNYTGGINTTGGGYGGNAILVNNSKIIGPTPYLLTPLMTSNTTPSGIASASSEFGSSFQAYKAFDRNVSSSVGAYWAASATGNQWLQYQFPTQRVFTSYQLPTAGLSNEPGIWTVSGSNDATTWTLLDSQGSHNTSIIYLNNITAYKYFRLNIINTSVPSSIPDVPELYIYGY